MPAVIEPIEMRKNNFSKWVFGVLVLLSILAFIISLNEPGTGKWVSVGGMVLFGAALLFTSTHKLLVDQQGMTINDILRTKTIGWNDITSLQYDIVYHGHGFQYVLIIKYGAGAMVKLPVKQYRKKQMLRLLEILDQQCPLADKNDSFKKLATGQLTWKDKLKML